MITKPEQAEDIIAGEQADAVFLARGLLHNPVWLRLLAPPKPKFE